MEKARGKILVVDDDAFIRLLITSTLEEEGYIIQTAENGKQGLERVLNESFDLILLDLIMPVMDGFEVLQWMKNSASLECLPVIVISGEEDMENIIRCINMGAVDYLPKPFDPVLLLTRIKNTLRFTFHDYEMSGNESGRILAADDDPLSLTLLTANLQEEGYHLETAQDGREAIEKLVDQPFDVALIDLLMPAMDGMAVLNTMKHDSRLCDIPVIMISGESDIDQVAHCIEMGAEDYLFKPFDPILLQARVSACLEKKRLRDLELKQQKQLNQMYKALEVRNRFIRKTFGRYLSDEIVDEVLTTPEGWSLGGEKRQVTIMMTDLRGFTSIGEGHSAETVITMLNHYFDAMVEILFKYGATIDEFQGDAILVLFGAPISHGNDADRAVACALEMQQVMEQVNQFNVREGYPSLAMGIGINTGDAVVGNIGSTKRMKYGVIGHNVNLTSRIESYTTGGQVFISEGTRNACGSDLRIDNSFSVMPKGVKEPVDVFEISGISGKYNIQLPPKETMAPAELSQALPIKFTILNQKDAGREVYPARIVGLSEESATIEASRECPMFSNLKIMLMDPHNKEIATDLYGKVTEVISASPPLFRVHFTSVSKDVEQVLKDYLPGSATRQ